MTTDGKQKSGEVDGINIGRLKTVFPRLRTRLWTTLTTYLSSLSCTVQSMAISLRYKPDVVYAHDYNSAVAAFMASIIRRSRYVLRQYGTTYFLLSRSSRIHRVSFGIFLFLPFKLPADMYIITNDGTLGDKAAESHGIPPHKLCFWVNGIHKDCADSSADREFRKKLAPADEKIVLSLCRLTWPKQVGVLIKAIPEVIDKYRKVKFVIVGDGDERPYLEKLVEDLGISDFVRFEGAVLHERALEYMKACDVFASMNGASSICNPVLEAMVCGKPVIALNMGATSELIKHNRNGVLVNADEIGRLPDTIVSLLGDEELAKRIGGYAQRFMLNNWPTWEERANLEVDLIEALCSDDPEKLTAAKKKADAALNLAIRLAKQRGTDVYC
jgi:glycosyltransferase involved in cell wall biosynthesis